MSHFDMLVKLYDIDTKLDCITKLEKQGVTIRKPIAPEKTVVLRWIQDNFAQAWVDEAEAAFMNSPKSIFIATKQNRIVGFACFDATVLNFFGPTGVCQSVRGLGIGKALLEVCMVDMKLKGYAYAIIGAVGPAEFYEKAVGATKIENSWPGAYTDLLKAK